jgi:nicotinate-nucleotide adenylyltransferase
MRKGKALRLGIFGGTFNPPHTGHLVVAEHIRRRLALDKVYFVPSYISPHKRRGEEKLAEHRLKMIRLATKGNPHFEVSDIELKRKGTSYTFETVEDFRKKYPNAELYLIIGADNFAEFYTWKNPSKILDLASLIVMNRPGHRLHSVRRSVANAARIVMVPSIEIASSTIRKMIRKGDSVAYLLPKAVAQYVHRHGLYC